MRNLELRYRVETSSGVAELWSEQPLSFEAFDELIEILTFARAKRAEREQRESKTHKPDCICVACEDRRAAGEVRGG